MPAVPSGAVKGACTRLPVVLALHCPSLVPDCFVSCVLEEEEDILPNCLKTYKHTFCARDHKSPQISAAGAGLDGCVSKVLPKEMSHHWN